MKARCFRAATKEDWGHPGYVNCFHDGYPVGSSGREPAWIIKEMDRRGWPGCRAVILHMEIQLQRGRGEK